MSEIGSPALIAFEYRYRDAANFKAEGSILLRGDLSPSARTEIISRLEGQEFFIAEQVGIPTLYNVLYAINGGRNEDDHCWHEFVGFSDIDNGTNAAAVWGDAKDFSIAFRGVKEWAEDFSPHFSVA